MHLNKNNGLFKKFFFPLDKHYMAPYNLLFKTDVILLAEEMYSNSAYKFDGFSNIYHCHQKSVPLFWKPQPCSQDLQ